MAPRMKPCPYPNCTKAIDKRSEFCFEHKDWKAHAAKRARIEYRTVKNCLACGNAFQITSSVNTHCQDCKTHSREKPCPYPGCDRMIAKRCQFCREHTNWNAIAAKRPKAPYSTIRNCAKCGEAFQITSGPNIHCERCRTVYCVICGKGFICSLERGKSTCSDECAKELRAVPILQCEYCGEYFKKKDGRINKYCGRKCKGLASRKVPDKTCKNRCMTPEARQWRRKILRRDKYTCQHCGVTEQLQAHHIKPWKDYPELAYDITNGITLCVYCHGKQHGKIFKTPGARKKASNCARCDAEILGLGKPPYYCRSCSVLVYYEKKRESSA